MLYAMATRLPCSTFAGPGAWVWVQVHGRGRAPALRNLLKGAGREQLAREGEGLKRIGLWLVLRDITEPSVMPVIFAGWSGPSWKLLCKSWRPAVIGLEPGRNRTWHFRPALAGPREISQ